MIEIPFLLTELIYTLVWVLLRAGIWAKHKKIDWKREAMLLLMYVNLAVILRVTFFPAARLNGHVQPLVFESAKVFPMRINWKPIVNLLRFASKRDLLLNLIGNFTMFIPSGIILPILYKKLNTFWKVVAAGAGISLCIEILQLPFNVRYTDIDDLILNTLGVAAGYGIYALVRTLRNNQRRRQ